MHIYSFFTYVTFCSSSKLILALLLNYVSIHVCIILFNGNSAGILVDMVLLSYKGVLTFSSVQDLVFASDLTDLSYFSSLG